MTPTNGTTLRSSISGRPAASAAATIEDGSGREGDAGFDGQGGHTPLCQLADVGDPPLLGGESEGLPARQQQLPAVK